MSGVGVTVGVKCEDETKPAAYTFMFNNRFTCFGRGGSVESANLGYGGMLWDPWLLFEQVR
jgi:hypothetical protein